MNMLLVTCKTLCTHSDKTNGLLIDIVTGCDVKMIFFVYYDDDKKDVVMKAKLIKI